MNKKDTIQNNLGEKSRKVKEAANSLQCDGSLQKEILEFANNVENLLSNTVALLGDISSGNILDAPSRVGNIMTDINKVIPQGEHIISDVEQGVKKLVPEIKETANDVWNFISDTASTVVNDVGHILGDVVDGKFGEIPDELKKDVNEVKGKINDGVAKISNDVKMLQNAKTVQETEKTISSPDIRDKAAAIAAGIKGELSSGDMKRSEQQQQKQQQQDVPSH